MKTLRILIAIVVVNISISEAYSIGFPVKAKKKKTEKVVNNKKDESLTESKLIQSIIIFKEIIQKVYFSR